jgi:disulfide oxidoreductase YuzD
MLKTFNSWLNEQDDPMAAAMPGAEAPAPAATGEKAQIRAILISNPIGSVDKSGDMVTKQYNEYVLDMGRVQEWIEKNAKESSQDILDYLNGKDIEVKDAHKKFTTAVQANEFGKPQTVIDVDFTKDGEPTTKDINLIFLA